MRSPGVRVRLGSASRRVWSSRTDTGTQPGGQVVSPSVWPTTGESLADGDLQDLVAVQRGRRMGRGRWRVGEGPAGGRVGLGDGGLGDADVAGDGLQHVLAGDPALQLLSVGGQHRQAVAAVEDQLAQRLG